MELHTSGDGEQGNVRAMIYPSRKILRRDPQ